MKTWIIGLLWAMGSLYSGGVLPQTLHASKLVESIQQQPPESFDQFIDLAAMRMSQHTASTGFEACGHIFPQTDTPLHAIMIFTGGSQIGCPSMSACPLGPYGLPGDFMHSHPHKRWVVLNEEDVKTLKHTKRATKKVGSWMLVSPNRFSDPDYELGPGYMIYQDKIWYQKGPGTAKRLRVVKPLQIETP